MKTNNRFCKGFRDVFKDSKVSLRPLNLLSRSVESASAISLRPLKNYDVKVLIRIPRSHWNLRIRFRGHIETAEADHFQRSSRITQRLRIHIWNGFSLWSGPKRGLMRKKRRKKISWKCSFKGNWLSGFRPLVFSFSNQPQLVSISSRYSIKIRIYSVPMTSRKSIFRLWKQISRDL
jgi:hypothetical protein